MTIINDADDGSADGSTMLALTCNSDGSAWENNGAAVTQVECAVEIPCLMCAANLITITTAGNGAKAMDGDVTDATGACAVRTFTCLGTVANMPNIELNNGQGVITDGSDGTVDGSIMLVLTCNAAGTAWESNGVAITQVECAVTPQCLMCAGNLIMVTTAGAGSKAMDGDVTDTTGVCAVRTFTCLGTSPNIENNNGVIKDGDDGMVDGMTTLVVTCNAAGTAWESNGVAITQVECTIPCKTCSANLITVTNALPGAKAMDGDVTVSTGACANNNGAIMDGDDGAVDGSTMLAVTCNAAGTAWESNGVPITNVECTIPCKTCAANLITVATAGNGAKPMDGDVTVTTGACAVRTFTCIGTSPTIVNNNGVITDVDNDGTTTLAITCNAAGTAWESNGVPITQVQCTIPCKTCAANLITVVTTGNGVKPMDGDVTVSTGACAVRTFTCMGSNPTIENNNGVITDVDNDGTTTLAVTCNAAGTAWESNGVPITQVQCTIPCKTCAANLIAVTTALPGAKAMDGDVTVSTGACAVRTFTCLGTNPTIANNNVAVMDGDDGAVDGMTTLAVTCNTAGTAWESNGVPITSVECVLPCKTCAANLITITMAGFGAKPFDGDITVTTGACAVRTFTCMGANMPNIEINNGFGVIEDQDDGVIDGVATFSVTCNAAGTGWESNGVTVTQLECSSIPPCQLCAANLITVTATLPGSKAMNGDVTVNTGACAVRTFTCAGAIGATIEMNGGATQRADGDDGTADGTATLVVTCNTAVTAWEVNGVAVTNVECTIPCLNCAPGLITLSTNGAGSKPFAGDTTSTASGCAVRTFTCQGTAASIEIDGGVGVIDDGNDGMIDGTATMAVTCSPDGTAWQYFGFPVTQLECSALPGG
ncbi:hypothetical protein PRIPAC_77204 [Pristionchus pacificus]|nr:hypothetical protein PRIPAC_77204 [Pristionchus pacificus]